MTGICLEASRTLSLKFMLQASDCTQACNHGRLMLPAWQHGSMAVPC